MAEYGLVTGEFYTHQKINEKPIPLSGTITFTPRANVHEGDRLYGADTRIGYVLDGVLRASKDGAEGLYLLAPSEGSEPHTWTYRATFSLSSRRDGYVPIEPFDFEVKANKSISLPRVSPVPNDRGVYVTKGEPGQPGSEGAKGDKGDDGIQGEKGDRGDTGARGEQGNDGLNGLGIADVALNDGQLTFRLDDGKELHVPLPMVEVPTLDPAIAQRLEALESRPEPTVKINDNGDGTATIS